MGGVWRQGSLHRPRPRLGNEEKYIVVKLLEDYICLTTGKSSPSLTLFS